VLGGRAVVLRVTRRGGMAARLAMCLGGRGRACRLKKEAGFVGEGTTNPKINRRDSSKASITVLWNQKMGGKRRASSTYMSWAVFNVCHGRMRKSGRTEKVPDSYPPESFFRACASTRTGTATGTCSTPRLHLDGRRSTAVLDGDGGRWSRRRRRRRQQRVQHPPAPPSKQVPESLSPSYGMGCGRWAQAERHATPAALLQRRRRTIAGTDSLRLGSGGYLAWARRVPDPPTGRARPVTSMPRPTAGLGWAQWAGLT